MRLDEKRWKHMQKIEANNLSTAEVAALGKVKPATLISSVSSRGNWMGLVPRKLPNGRLMWDSKAVADLLCGGAK